MATLEQMINQALDRNATATGGESLIVSNHLAQMRLFGIRQGVELFPVEDSGSVRKRFIDRLYRDNRIELFLDRIWDIFLCRGQICWYLRPTGGSYRIYHYAKDQFKGFYGSDGELIKVIIKYHYEVDGEGLDLVKNRRWVRLEITATQIIQSESEGEPSFTGPFIGTADTQTVVNSLGFIPCVITNNYLTEAGTEGKGEFDWLASQLEAHDSMMRAIKENLEFFGNPTLVTTRSASEVTEAIENAAVRNSMASMAQFVGVGPNGGSTFKRDPFQPSGGGSNGGERVRKIIGSVEPNERFGYVVPDPVSPDQAQYARSYQESLHSALGGVDPLGISAGATAYEIKSMYGKSAATARKKAVHLYTYGICQIFSMAIAAEEMVFKAGLARAIGLEDANEITDDYAISLLSAWESGEETPIPKGFKPDGLPPLGDRSVDWKWLGPVFEDSPNDLQQRSIVVRNLEELGVETVEALKFLFPGKTAREIERMLTGFPFREMNSAANALMQQTNIFGQMMQIENPMQPGTPLAQEFNNLPILSRIMAHIQKRLGYGEQPGERSSPPIGVTSAPDSAADNTSGNAAGGAAGNAVQPIVPNAGIGGYGAPIPSSPYGPGIPISADGSPTLNNSGWAAGLGLPAAGYPTASGFARSGAGIPEYAAGLPQPGGTIERNNRSISNPQPPIPAGIPIQPGPGILQQLFPTLYSIANVVRPNANSGGNASGSTDKRGSTRANGRKPKRS